MNNIKARDLADNDAERAAILASQAGDVSATEALVRFYTPHIYKLASKASRRFEADVDDLFQEGVVALLETIPRYEVYPTEPAILWTKASRRVAEAINECGQSTHMAISVPSSTLTHTTGRTPAVATAIAAAMSPTLAIVPGDEEASHPNTISAGTVSDANVVAHEDTATSSATAHRLMDTLPERDRQVIRLSFGFEGSSPMTDREVAAVLGVSHPRITRIRNRALARMAEVAS